MTMVRPVLRDDPFAGVGWSTSLTLLALKKLSLGERLHGDELQSIKDTMVFVSSLLLSPDPYSAEGHRTRLFWAKSPLSLPREQLGQLERDLNDVLLAVEHSVTFVFDSDVAKLLERAGELVLRLLETINHCRS